MPLGEPTEGLLPGLIFHCDRIRVHTGPLAHADLTTGILDEGHERPWGSDWGNSINILTAAEKEIAALAATGLKFLRL